MPLFSPNNLNSHTSFVIYRNVFLNLQNTEEDLPVCNPRVVCSKVDLYESPWLERQCRCPNKKNCPGSLASDDGFTIADKTRQYKMCESVKKLPKCRYAIGLVILSRNK